MKICLINNLYKPFERGGAERIVSLLADAFIDRGDEVMIITTRPVLSEMPKLEKIKVFYLRAFYYHLNKWPFFLRIFWHVIDMFDWGSYIIVKSILQKEKPDLVITNNLKGIGFLIPKVIKKLGIKHIHICHDVQLLHPSGLMICGKEKKLKGMLAAYYAKINKCLFGSPDNVIFPSHWLESLHREAGFFPNSKISVLSNPAQLIDASIGSRVGMNEHLRFLFVGQLTSHKGVIFLINAFNHLYCEQRNMQCELHIVGDGPQFKKASKLAKTNPQIFFYGKKTNEEVKTLMMSSDVLVVPSLCHENSPTVIYEAASVGLPVIASRVGGTTELVESLSGLLFEPGNEGDLMHAMHQVAKDRELLKKISQESSTKIQDYGINNYIDKLLSL